MMFIRPVQKSDLDQLEKLALEAGIGLTSLPPDRVVLQRKIQASLDSFEKELQEAEDESYLFVIEDSFTGEVAGTTGVVSAVGLNQPFYTYRLSTTVLHSAKHNIYNKYRTLNLVNDFTGASEICTLFLSPRHRKGTNGKLLSRCRFLFMAEFPHRIADVVLAEMRGVQDEEGKSPFWKNLGAHFFKMDFSKADYLSAVENDFINDLMPKQPVYEDMLPEKAREVIGKVHGATLPALKMLEKEGLSFEGYVDIFDAGPSVHCKKQNIYSVRNSARRTVQQGTPDEGAVDCLISNTSLQGFRACIGKISLTASNEAILSAETMQSLQVKEGELIRSIPLTYHML